MKKFRKGNISSIETSGFVDGPGVRVVVFMQGCPLRCLYCHNPETWDKNVKKDLMTSEEVLEKVLKYKEYFGQNGGVTFSGGEPLSQQSFVTECLKLCKENGIHTALDTSGGEKLTTKILDYVDLVILDVKAVSEKDYTFITGQKRKNFDNFLSACQQKKVPLWIRQVIVPGLNDTEKSVLELKEFLKNIKYVEKVELLPYHDMAVKKYKQLGMKYRLEGVKAMDKEKCKNLQKLLSM